MMDDPTNAFIILSEHHSNVVKERDELQARIDAALATYKLYRSGMMSMVMAIHKMKQQLKGDA